MDRGDTIAWCFGSGKTDGTGVGKGKEKGEGLGLLKVKNLKT